MPQLQTKIDVSEESRLRMALELANADVAHLWAKVQDEQQRADALQSELNLIRSEQRAAATCA